MTFRERSRALFLPHRRWLDAEAGLLQAGGWFGPRQCVVPRADCLHRRLPFGGVPANQREQALALAAEREAPAAGGRHAVRWQGDVAQLWLLPAERSASLSGDEVLVAESSLLPPPRTPDADRLVAVQRGVEGQVWREGELRASRWWPSVPDGDAWARFLRASGLPVPPDPRAPPVETHPLLSEPWGRAGGRLAWAPAQLESAFWAGLVAFAAAVIGWQVAAGVVWTVAAEWQAHRVERLRESAAPLIAARERAEAARDRIAAYGALTATPVDLLLLAELRARLPAEARLGAWFRDAAQLRVEVEGGGSDPRTFVQALAPHPVLSTVVANPLPNGRMQLDIQLEAADGADEVLP